MILGLKISENLLKILEYSPVALLSMRRGFYEEFQGGLSKGLLCLKLEF